jgi:CBS domain-containing protein
MASIKGLMRKHMVAVSEDANVGSAIRMMKKARVTVVPVIGKEGLTGVLTMEEAEKEHPDMKLSDLNLRLLYVGINEKPEAAARIMVENNLCRLPVVDGSGDMRCVGVVTSTDIARSHKKRLL